MTEPVQFIHRYNDVMADILAEAQPAWLHHRRSEAYGLFQKLGLPTTRDEDWKYTSLTGIERAELDAAAARIPAYGTARIDSFDFAEAHRLIFVDGRFDASLSILREPEAGVTLMPLAEAVTLNRPAASEFMGKLDCRGESLAAFNAALWRDGLYLELDRGARLTRPLIVQCLSTAGRLVPMRHLIVLGEAAQATVIEHYQSLQAGVHFTSVVTECLLGANARLTHVKLQDENDQAFHIARVLARQGSGSHWTSLAVCAGARLARNDIISQLEGEAASCTLNGLAIGTGRRHADHHLYVNHRQPRGVSRQHYRGVLADRSRVVFNGRVRVEKGAVKTDAQQLNRNLMLSRDAEADSKPQLEIYADDVQCSHGSATGGLDEAQLFYLRSRGIDDRGARAMLVQAFAVATFDALPEPALKQALTCLIERKLLMGDL
ncbi:MAG: Fe-S cluster assembly protein SufD [Thiobacillaceae bacterium]